VTLSLFYKALKQSSLINWDSRHYKWPHKDPVCMVDVTECPIWNPLMNEWEYYSVKSQCHTLKYELAISMRTHRILWVSGPFKGSVHDLRIARSNFVNVLGSSQRALADKGYIGDFHFIVPFKPPRGDKQKAFNLNHYTVRQSIERMNKRLKHFSCLRQKWRLRGPRGILLHKLAFFFICYVTQLTLEERPLTRRKK